MITIFNPDHDFCLANGDRHYCSSATSRKFAEDCSDIMRYVDDCQCFVPGGDVLVWGWDPVVRLRLMNMGIDPSCLPDEEAMARIRILSHRRTSLELNAFLQKNLTGQDKLAYPFQMELDDVEELSGLVGRLGECIVKAPWSSSGKGLRRLRDGVLTENERGRIARVMEKQGGVIVESLDEVVLDFAMLFETGEEGTVFRGYSLFENERCAYSRGILAGDDFIRRRVASYVGEDCLMRVREGVTAFLNMRMCSPQGFRGPLGVDMYVCRDAGGVYRLRPCVEINLRLTMGFVAHRLFIERSGLLKEGETALQLLHSSSNAGLRRQLADPQVIELLTSVRPDTLNAFVIRRI